MRRFSVAEFSGYANKFNVLFENFCNSSRVRLTTKIDEHGTSLIFRFSPFIEIGDDQFLSHEMYGSGDGHAIIYLSDEFYSTIEGISEGTFGEKVIWNNSRSSGFICVNKVLSGEEKLAEMNRLDIQIKANGKAIAEQGKKIKKLREKCLSDNSYKNKEKIKDAESWRKTLQDRLMEDMKLHNSLLEEAL